METSGEVEIPTAAEAELAVAVETPEVAVETPEVAVETPVVEPEVETPEVAVETPEVEQEVETPEVAVETPEVKVAAAKIPAENVEVDVEVSGAIEGAAAAVGTVEVTGEIEKEVEVEDQKEAEMFAGVQTPTEKEELQSDSGDDLSPEEVQQKLAALGEPLSDENNESDEDEEPLSPSRMRFEASVSMLESVPEDEDGRSESEEESEGSSVGEAGGKHTNVGNDNDDVTAF